MTSVECSARTCADSLWCFMWTTSPTKISSRSKRNRNHQQALVGHLRRRQPLDRQRDQRDDEERNEHFERHDPPRLLRKQRAGADDQHRQQRHADAGAPVRQPVRAPLRMLPGVAEHRDAVGKQRQGRVQRHLRAQTEGQHVGDLE